MTTVWHFHFTLDKEEFEDNKGAIRRTDNTMAKRKYKRTNNDLQNIHIKLRID
jgi:hypothetical protein